MVKDNSKIRVYLSLYTKIVCSNSANKGKKIIPNSFMST